MVYALRSASTEWKKREVSHPFGRSHLPNTCNKKRWSLLYQVKQRMFVSALSSEVEHGAVKIFTHQRKQKKRQFQILKWKLGSVRAFNVAYTSTCLKCISLHLFKVLIEGVWGCKNDVIVVLGKMCCWIMCTWSFMLCQARLRFVACLKTRLLGIVTGHVVHVWFFHPWEGSAISPDLVNRPFCRRVFGGCSHLLHPCSHVVVVTLVTHGFLAKV